MRVTIQQTEHVYNRKSGHVLEENVENEEAKLNVLTTNGS